MRLNLLRSCLLLIFLSISGEVFSLEGDTYSFDWLDPDKEVYVLQNRKYRKKGRLYFNAGGGVTTSGAFVKSTVLQGRVGYFARESIGFEFIYSYNDGEENDTAESVRESVIDSGSAPFRRIVENYLGGMLMWAPFYSKINTFNQVIYADWLLGLGYAKLEEHNNEIELLTMGERKNETKVSHHGLLWNLGMKIYLTRMLEFRVDLTTIFYRTDRIRSSSTGKKIWYSNWDAVASLGLSF